MTAQVEGPAPPGNRPENQAAAKLLDATILTRAADIAAPQAMHDPHCGRCADPSGPEGAWCDNCINECREYTRRLDSQAASGDRR